MVIICTITFFPNWPVGMLSTRYKKFNGNEWFIMTPCLSFVFKYSCCVEFASKQNPTSRDANQMHSSFPLALRIFYPLFQNWTSHAHKWPNAATFPAWGWSREEVFIRFYFVQNKANPCRNWSKILVRSTPSSHSIQSQLDNWSSIALTVSRLVFLLFEWIMAVHVENERKYSTRTLAVLTSASWPVL